MAAAAAARDGDYDYAGDDVGSLSVPELWRLVDLSHSQAKERRRKGKGREGGGGKAR